ncbi:MAG: N-6 DNA methylase [Acidimicrobiia bacterium]|nr:N-6 DNA methylase [Acidimicrobiia bacterium]
MSDLTSRITVDIGQIAQIATVGRSAVGNWRKRHSDFPVADASGRFDLTEVERWLIENGKIDSRVPAEFFLWSLIDSLRNFGLQADQITRLLVSLLVYLEACDISLRSSIQQAAEVTVNENDHWKRLRQLPTDAVGQELRRAARHVEQDNQVLDGLLVSGLSVATSLPNDLLVSLIKNLEACTDEATPRFTLFTRVVSRAAKLDIFRGEHSTPADIAELMVQLAGQDAGMVCDLACGEGGLLSSAALRLQPRGSKQVELVGFEIDEGALRIARSQFFLEGTAAELRLEDTLRVPLEDLPKADVVLLDPPLARRNWGDADLYVDERWRFGAPPRTNADLAWMQLAVECLSDSGVAVVGTSPRTASNRSGREADIRKAMLKEGVIKAVVQLPTRMRAETSVPMFLWVLQPPRPGAHSVMLIDASSLGTASRSQHNLDSDDIARIARALQALETGKVEDEEIAQIVSIIKIIEKDAVLEPKVYRPISRVNIKDIRLRSEELRATLSDTAKGTASVVEQVLIPSAGTGDQNSTSTRAVEEIAEIHLGTRGADLDTADEEALLVGIREVSADGASPPRYVEGKAASRQVVEVKENDVVVALRGSTGRSILATEHHEGAVLDHGCALIRPIGDKISGEWIYLWTQSKQFRDRVSRSTTGVTMPTLTSRALRELTIPIPTAEQLSEAEQMTGRFREAIDKVGELLSDLRELRDLEVELLIAHDAGTE